MSRLLPALLLVMAPALARAGALDDFYRAVVAADPRLAIASASQDVAEAQRRQALAELLPQASAQASLTRTRQERSGLVDSDPVYYDGERYSINLQQPIFDARRFKLYQASRVRVSQSAHEESGTRSEVRYDTIDRYLAALSAAERLRLARQEEETAATQQAQVESLFKRQMTKVTDLMTVQARADGLRAGRLRAEAAYQVALDALAELAGQPVTVLAGLEESAVLPPVDDTLAAVEERAAAVNENVQALRDAAVRAGHDLGAARARRLPVLGLQLAAQRSNIGYENSLLPRTETGVVGVNVTLPLFTGGALSAMVGETRARRRIADLELESGLRQARVATRSAWLQLRSLESQVAAAHRAVESGAKAVEANEKGYRLGVATLVDVLDARRDAFAAERDYADVRHEYLRQWALLAELTGTLDDAAVRRLSALLVRPVDGAVPPRAGGAPE
ncbi:MAG: TolC family protein [Steroidobacteraceae bacterium]